jgi:hypothetical protein
MEAAAIPAAHKVRGIDMSSRRKKVALMFLLATAPALALAQEHGSGEGGGCGDVLGDLVHILRHATTGQPILQMRPVLLPQDVPGTAYCPIPIDEDGNEIGFLPDSCDVADPEAVVEVDYFGRLSGGRTKERNSRMHFDEVISSIKDAGWVGQDETGRLKLGFECTTPGDPASCAAFSMIDSPMENMALYTRLMKYGHFQTDPMEKDTWAHGDPAAGTQYHPALDVADWGKFDPSIWHLLPGNPDPGEFTAVLTDACFPGGVFNDCAGNESLSKRDFLQAALYLAGAANKTGKITVDLVQYMNRILKITLKTEMSTATLDTLPALIRDCGDDNGLEFPAAGGNCDDPYKASLDLPAPANELFVDFHKAKYNRPDRYGNDDDGTAVMVRVLQDEGGVWNENDVSLFNWLLFADSIESGAINDINGFVQAASDGLRSIEFVHNYAIPDDLWTLYAPEE